MSDFKPSVRSAVIARPRCEECSIEMWLLDIKPAQAGQELRTFECARCASSKTILCRNDGK